MRKVRPSGPLKLVLSILAVFGLAVATPQLASANSSGGEASGSYQFSFEDGYTKYIEFDARAQADGSATGSMTFTDEAEISDQDVDGADDPNLNRSPTGIQFRAEFDGLAINRNMAVMSGTIRDSNLPNYIGRRVLLVVQDNGTNEPDKLSWGIYNPIERTWTPKDAELEDDHGASMTWTATDAELRDDVGIPSRRDESINCQTFAFESYSFVDAARGAGNIQFSE